MATQRITVAKIAGAAGVAVAKTFSRWAAADRSDESAAAVRRDVDRFVQSLKAHAATLPVVYFAEWIDLWLMGDVVPGLAMGRDGVVNGNRFEAACHTLPVVFPSSMPAAGSPQEMIWLETRLREAECAWEELTPDAVLVLVREVLGPTVTDDELRLTLTAAPDWVVCDG